MLPLALSRPREALAGRGGAGRASGPYEASVAHQAAGIVLREFGDIEAGVRELRAALRLARRTGRPNARPTCWPAWASRSSTRAGRRPAWPPWTGPSALSTGVLAARVLARRGVGAVHPGPVPGALDDLRQAVSVLRRAGDTALDGSRAQRPWAGLPGARVDRPGRCGLRGRRAPVRRAGQELEAVYAVHNRGAGRVLVRGPPGRAGLPRRGRLPLPAAERAHPPLSLDRCDVLLAAGLASDALAEADAAVAEIEQVRGWSTKQAELLLMAANCALAAAQPQAAQDWAQAAYRLFRSQHSAWWQAHAGARAGPGPVRGGPGLGRAAARGGPGGRPAGGARRQRRDPGAPAGRAGGAGPRPPRRRRPASGRGGPGPAARPGAGPGQRLARRGAAGRGRGPAAPDAGRLPPRPRRAGRAPAHPRCLRAAGAGHGARRRAGRAGPAPCRAGGPPAAAAGLERTLAGHRAGRARGAARGRRGAQRQPGRAARA